ncbi:Mitogen-activated protein kinase 15 isoform C [Glycine soja]|uniref:Mitogen-activated protein kinase 15 isoform B n=1 Tax=Glycine soja TaxID=3848 RepID=A0A445KYQ9_GLYSO|nr:Mitogen-activated protein kinase 15 isoform B [Glycine soja]RZC16088.1 Mitogen-activated protein kinase 15 isoform C [Glycine soja]
MNCEPSTQPISKLEFEFERRKLTKDDVRELIYGEILEYHPQMLQEYLRGGDQTSFMYPRFLWMVRIGGGEYRVDKGAAPKMLNCLINRIPEAALMARSYLPSMISVTIWRKDLSKHPLCVPPPEDPMGQAVGMEDPPTSMYNLFAPIEDDPYVPIAPVSPVHDFVIPPIPPLCYPYAPVPYKGYGPLIPRVHFRDPPPSPIAPKTPIHPPIPVPSPNRQSDMPKG